MELLCTKALFCGPYSKLKIAYGKILEWIAENDYKISGNSYDKYITGQADGGETSTEIYFPVEKIS